MHNEELYLKKFFDPLKVCKKYKPKFGKNGDIDNIAVAWSQGYLPVFAIFSGQIDDDLVLRYKNSRGGVIVGNLTGSPYDSLFVFCKEVLDYDMELNLK
jgi:hypothetical protein